MKTQPALLPIIASAHHARRTIQKFFVLVVGIAVFAPVPARSQESGGTVAGFLSGQGLAGAKLQRRVGNLLYVPVSVNNKRGALAIDTGAPLTIIDKSSAATFGLKVENTKVNVAGVVGKRWEKYGVSVAKSIAMGNCVLANVPVALAYEFENSDVDRPSTGSHIPEHRTAQLNGLLGAREMRKFGMIIDCTRQMLYVNPNGASAGVSQKLAGLLASRGFTRIPMRENSSNHFDVPVTINGHATRFVVDTGASTTLMDKKAAVEAGVAFADTMYAIDGGEGRSARIGTGNVKELGIGDFKIPQAQVAAANVSAQVLHSKDAAESNAGLLGAEYLAFNFAIIDVGGMALYLRHPDSR